MSQNLFENFCYKNFNLVMMIVFWINRVAYPQAQLLFLQYFVIPVLFFDSTLFHFMRILLSFLNAKIFIILMRLLGLLHFKSLEDPEHHHHQTYTIKRTKDSI